MTSDVIVVGAGHNGLICAAYLARAGIDTLLLEARDDVGGCASTVSDLGARFNICNCDHTLIRAMPIQDELELADHGLHYLEPDLGGLYLFHDDTDPWVYFHEVERMLDALDGSHPDQVDGYRRYLADALPVARLVIDMARTVPGGPRMLATAASRPSGGGGRSERAEAAARLIRWSRMSVDDVLGRYFDDWHLRMPAISMGPTVWGVPPSVPGTGLAALGYATRHLVRTGRPRGGSGALTDAARSSFEAAGGRVRCGARVGRMLVADGAVRGVALTDGTELTAGTVIAACDPQRVFVDWLDDPPAAARRLVDHWRQAPVHDGYESKVDAVCGSAPRYRAAGAIEARLDGIETMGPTAVISPSPEDLADSHAAMAEGRVPARPTILANVPSVLDPDLLTPDGDHVLSVEVLHTPYSIDGGWPDSPEPRRWLDVWADFLEPGALDSMGSWRAMTPDRYEDEFSMYRGHTPSYAGSPLAALTGRRPELTRYRTPIEGLYLSGAATFPGAGIFGAAGRNTAHRVLDDLAAGRGRGVGRLVAGARRETKRGARRLARGSAR